MTRGSAHNAGESSGRREGAAAWVALLLIAGPTLLRVLITPTAMPWWDADPAVSPPTGTSITPSGVLTLDVLTVLGAALAFWAIRLGRRAMIEVGLLAVGAIAVLWHGSRETEHLVIGGPWIAGLAAMLGAGWLGRRREFRGLLLGLGFGVVALLLARSAVQVFVDHPQTVAHFRANREQMLAAQGWAPGSPQALMYERRLMQPDATAWFGLSNVLATFAAGASVFGLAMGLVVRDRAGRLAAIALGVVGLVLLWMTASKGGWGAAAIGGLAAGLFVLFGRAPLTRRWRGGLPLAAAIGVLLIVGVRGLVGERMGELSLLFRSQYLGAAWRIFLQHPMDGVGPAGFQDAYLLAKNPLNPEEITSPHSVFFDWLATLGLLGLPWAWLLLRRGWFSVGTGSKESVEAEPAEPREGADPVAIRVAILLPILLFAVSAWFERAMLLPVEIVARMLGVAAWIGLTLVIARIVRTTPAARLTPVFIGAGAALLAHAQIELTSVHAGSAPLLFVLIGAMWCGSSPGLEDRSAGLGLRVVGSVALLGVAGVMAWVGLRPLLAWEGHLRAAAVPMVEVGRTLGLNPNQPPERLLGPARRVAIEELGRAVDARPDHTKTRIEVSRLSLRSAVSERAQATRWLDSARGWVLGPTDRTLDARTLRWLAVIDRVAIEEGLTSEPAVIRAREIDSLLAASELDPYDAPLARMLAEANAGAGRGVEAARWARRALELDEQLRLDPLKRFTAEERARLEALAGGG